MTDDANQESPDEHEAGVRWILAKVHGEEYRTYRTLDEARQVNDSAVILQGDWGGQIYVTCPVRHVVCTEEKLRVLLHDLNEIAWPANGDDPEDDGSGMYFEAKAIGSHVSGGMGGAIVIDGVWVHYKFVELGIHEQIRLVIEGRRERLTSTFAEVVPILRESRKVRRQMQDLEWPGELLVRVVSIARSHDEAIREVERLNSMQHEDYHYFFKFAPIRTEDRDDKG